MSYDTRTLPAPAREAESTDGSGQWPVVLFLLATVVLLDQVTKWWGWRTFEAIINTGGSRFVGSAVGAWYSDRITGPLLDLLDLGVVSAALYILARRRRPSSVLAAGAVMICGWGSNLLDRLGMHNVTAPGAARGAVDFLHIGQHYYNVADLFIAGATPLFLLTVGYAGWRTTHMRARHTAAAYRQQRMTAKISGAASAVCFLLIVAVGAVN